MPDRGYGGGADAGSNQNDNSFSGGASYDSGYSSGSRDTTSAAGRRAAAQRAQNNAKSRQEAQRRKAEEQRKADIKKAQKEASRANTARNNRGRKGPSRQQHKGIGNITMEQEVANFGVFDTLLNHLFGVVPGVDVQARMDFNTGKRTENKSKFGFAEAIGDVASLAIGAPLVLGALGSKVDDALGTRTEIGAAPTTLAAINGATVATNVKSGQGGKGAGENVAQAGDGLASHKTNTTDTSTNDVTEEKPGPKSSDYGDENRNPVAARQIPTYQGVSLAKSTVAKTPVKPTTSNGSANDDLFELYRKMLGGFFRGSKV